ncbi:ATP-dependent Clp protease adaptor ClpS [Bradyrhizobium pachyrhizi]|uniref:ATP-dependent Clp protease adaptor ClpS n=1 Tax=Bradyrhizobium pachyrhizi TaxID=280333 RepID=UPI0024B16F74|nr:ATP-dependent Clp protease adaptor ClpS [Bradyrhizobium pachyrhizi]WFU54710.1 ATP-dependent Clp protease adaptor ClpS [Bradyrhizobium pachyrhizi]
MQHTPQEPECSPRVLMDPVCADADFIQLVFHNDDDTPVGFVVRLLREVFGKQQRDAVALAEFVWQQGKAVCGPYPPSVAKALIEEAQKRIRAAGFPLLITTEAAGKADTADLSDVQFEYACDALDWHFANFLPGELATTARHLPAYMRADVQVAIDKLFADPIRFFGAYERHWDEALSFARMKRRGSDAISLVPPQFDEIDTGELAPAKCLRNGLWLCQASEFPYAVVLSHDREFGRETRIRIEIIVPARDTGDSFVQCCFDELEKTIRSACAYRGKIISLDEGADCAGRISGVTLHRLPQVKREDVILPERALKLLDRSVLGFVDARDELRRLRQSTRRGILLYGPPGTGKTHTVRYLATNLPGYTTLIITAEQLELLSAYMTLARLLQPTMVVIDDVDRTASNRSILAACEVSLLSKLLNEIDGLKEDADILFVLTTNRPDQFEVTLADCHGRIDQAIEIPLPDAASRGKLIRLYSGGLPLEGEIIAEAVRSTEGVSAIFIKELMRRVTQSSIARDGGHSVITADVHEALDDMLFASGRLNAKLLGGPQAIAAGARSGATGAIETPRKSRRARH